MLRGRDCGVDGFQQCGAAKRVGQTGDRIFTAYIRYPTNPLGLFLIIPPERQRDYWPKGQGDLSERAKLGLIANANLFGT